MAAGLLADSDNKEKPGTFSRWGELRRPVRRITGHPRAFRRTSDLALGSPISGCFKFVHVVSMFARSPSARSLIVPCWFAEILITPERFFILSTTPRIPSGGLGSMMCTSGSGHMGSFAISSNSESFNTLTSTSCTIVWECPDRDALAKLKDSIGWLVVLFFASLIVIDVEPGESFNTLAKVNGTNSRKIWLSVLLSILKSEKTLELLIWLQTWGPPDVLLSPAQMMYVFSRVSLSMPRCESLSIELMRPVGVTSKRHVSVSE